MRVFRKFTRWEGIFFLGVESKRNWNCLRDKDYQDREGYFPLGKIRSRKWIRIDFSGIKSLPSRPIRIAYCTSTANKSGIHRPR